MICVHSTKRFNPVIVICGSIAKKENIDLSGAQSLKAIGEAPQPQKPPSDMTLCMFI